jgi:hypothetical protein
LSYPGIRPTAVTFVPGDSVRSSSWPTPSPSVARHAVAGLLSTVFGAS